MGITYRVDTQDGLTYVMYDGVVTEADFVAHAHRLKADPAWPHTRKIQLTDLTSQRNPQQLSAAVIEQVGRFWAAEAADVLPGMKIAVVASDGFANAELFQKTISESGLNLIVFNTLITACIWLGIDADRAARVLNEMRNEARGS